MTPTIRFQEAGGTYHVNANAAFGRSLFRDEIDHLTYLELLAEEVTRSRWTILEYTLMTTHFHVLLKIEDCTLSSGFQRVQSRYARAFNRRHKRRGVVWQKRFHDEPVTSERHLYETIRYIARNAPRVGLCEKPEEYFWCSYGAAVSGRFRDPLVAEAELLALFDHDPSVARSKLRAFVDEPDPRVRWRQTRV